MDAFLSEIFKDYSNIGVAHICEQIKTHLHFHPEDICELLIKGFDKVDKDTLEAAIGSFLMNKLGDSYEDRMFAKAICLGNLAEIEKRILISRGVEEIINDCITDLAYIALCYSEHQNGKKSIPDHKIYIETFNSHTYTMIEEIWGNLGLVLNTHKVAVYRHLTLSLTHKVKFDLHYDIDNLNEIFNTTQKECLEYFLCNDAYTETLLKSMSRIPLFLRTGKALKIWSNLVRAGFLNNQLKPRKDGVFNTTRKELAFIAFEMNKSLENELGKRRTPWKVFEQMFGVANLKQDYANIKFTDESVLPSMKDIEKCIYI